MKAILVVDMINDFIDEKGKLSLKEAGIEIIDTIEAKLDEARANGDIVVYLNDAHDEDDAEFARFPTHAIKDTWGAMVIDRLTPCEDDFIISKQRYSGFYNTLLGALLEDLKPEEVEVVGCCTSICVSQTIADLANRDYKVVVDRKAVADFNPAAQAYYLDYQLPTIFGTVVV